MGRIVYRRTLLRGQLRPTRFLSSMPGVNPVFKNLRGVFFSAFVGHVQPLTSLLRSTCFFVLTQLIVSDWFSASYHTVLSYRIVQ